METEIIKKKRGRKPKNHNFDEIVVEKKKRGRKKKYEIENFEKINNRDHLNNFDHSIVYSSDEEINSDENKCKIAFGNLNITVSKKVTLETENFKNIFHSPNIDKDEYSSEEEIEPELRPEITLELTEPKTVKVKLSKSKKNKKYY